ncbi:MAG: ABC transporter ATP-binding protein, partial [Saprospiraceae bacterium]|nr:ABC transporter ATP-binding protein [Saprospiraceae bacterium]
PHQISGGQKQRVMIAMAMAAQPKLLIADEPTTALDAHVRRSILDLIKRLSKAHGLAVLFISHDMDAVRYIADRILVMQKGLLVEQAETTQILNNPQKAYTKGLITCKPPLRQSLHRLPTLDHLDPTPSPPIKASTTDAEPILRVDHLVVDYGSTSGIFSKKKSVNRAVNDVSFTLHSGKTLGIIGESGSGKSTIGNAILKFVSPTSGKISFNQQDLSALKGSQLKAFRKAVQVIQQDPYSALNPRQRIGESIREPLAIHQIGSKHEQVKRVEELLELVELKAADYQKYPHEFSGGQRQRICIARALTLNPQLIICDESVSALDLSVQATILNLLKSLQEQLGLAYLFITHDLAVARFIADDILVLQEGKVQEYGSSEQIIDRPTSEYTKALLEQVEFR